MTIFFKASALNLRIASLPSQAMQGWLLVVNEANSNGFFEQYKNILKNVLDVTLIGMRAFHSHLKKDCFP